MNLQHIKHIGLCSTARFTETSIISQAKTWLEEHGFKVTLASNLTHKHHQFGGDDNLRTAAFQTLLNNTSIDGIWCLRGGYGTVRMIDNLDWTIFKTQPKYLIGFSDFTILLNHVLQFKVTSIHAPMPIQLPTLEPLALERLTDLLHGQFNSITWPKDEHSSNVPIKGTLVGGNLSMLYSFMGSSSFPSTENAILFIEDLDEYSYHLDRMMYGLLRSGSLKGINGILVGSFTSIHDHDIPFGESYMDIFAKFAKHLKIPIYFNFPAGHINNNQPLVLGKQISISPTSGNQFILNYHEQTRIGTMG